MPRLRANSTSVSRSPTIAERSRSSGAALTKSRTSPIAGLRHAQLRFGQVRADEVADEANALRGEQREHDCVGALERLARMRRRRPSPR